MWSVYIKSGNNWIYSGTIPVPNDDLDLSRNSNISKQVLANGDIAFTISEIKYVDDTLRFSWTMDDSSLKNQIREYISNGSQIKILTHLSGEVYIGMFLNVKATWLVGQEPDEFLIEANFERMSGL